MKQGNNMKKILILIGSMSIFCPAILVADNMLPPAGPYRSIENEVAKPNNIVGNMQDAKGNQAVMQGHRQYMPQSNQMQNQNNTNNVMQWNQRQQAPMNGRAQRFVPQAASPQLSQPQMNRMKQYFPASRGPVYGPNVPPPGIRNNQNYQNTPPVNQYPPMWR